jgi:hypothetical protein
MYFGESDVSEESTASILLSLPTASDGDCMFSRNFGLRVYPNNIALQPTTTHCSKSPRREIFCPTVESNYLEDITPCSLLKVNQVFGRIYRLHHQGRISRARYQSASRRQEKIVIGNFGLHRKQEGNGRMELSSHWLAERTSRRREQEFRMALKMSGFAVKEKDRQKCNGVLGRKPSCRGEMSSE